METYRRRPREGRVIPSSHPTEDGGRCDLIEVLASTPKIPQLVVTFRRMA